MSLKKKKEGGLEVERQNREQELHRWITEEEKEKGAPGVNGSREKSFENSVAVRRQEIGEGLWRRG